MFWVGFDLDNLDNSETCHQMRSYFRWRGLSSILSKPTDPDRQLNTSMAISEWNEFTKIDWGRVLRQSRLGNERWLGFTVKARSSISPDAPLCLRCGAYMLKRTGSFGPFWGCGQFPRCRATQKRAESGCAGA
jgi:hypothetical protein